MCNLFPITDTMRYQVLLILFILHTSGYAQTYKYIGINNGLSSRNVNSIRKDITGYMWFLTDNGADRYDGKNFRNYQLTQQGKTLPPPTHFNWLENTPDTTLWAIGKKGKIFRYDRYKDEFVPEYEIEQDTLYNSSFPVTGCQVDSYSNIWLSNNRQIICYNTLTKTATNFSNQLGTPILSLACRDTATYYFGTNNGVYTVELRNNQLLPAPVILLNNLDIGANTLHYDPEKQLLLVGCMLKGCILYDIQADSIIETPAPLRNTPINHISPLNNREYLIGTGGKGIWVLNPAALTATTYLMGNDPATPQTPDGYVQDLYSDNAERVWAAVFSGGIIIRNNRFPQYQWTRHLPGNSNSLVNNQVNYILEDSSGRYWYATNNGVSRYDPENHKWKNYLNQDDTNRNRNQVYISLCEISPGVIWCGTNSARITEIDTHRKTIRSFDLNTTSDDHLRPDKYIRSILRTTDGNIWIGGHYSLYCLDRKLNILQTYPGITSVNTVVERDEKFLWAGTSNGLHLLDRTTGKYTFIDLPIESGYIYDLFCDKDSLLYIGSFNSGLLEYNFSSNQVKSYTSRNSSLLSDNIYKIIPTGNNRLFLSTEDGISYLDKTDNTIANWTGDQGLTSNRFNPASGLLTSRGTLQFGSFDGFIEFKQDIELPREYPSKLVFSDFNVFYKSILPGTRYSPLNENINDIRKVRLKHNQNIFSLLLSAINYDYPSNILYSWKLDGFYNNWVDPTSDNRIDLTNLTPGKYTLNVRAVSRENLSILDERKLPIEILKPVWQHPVLLFFYIFVLFLILIGILHLLLMQKDQNTYQQKIKYFINTANEIRNPLTLIKSPLETIAENEQLSHEGKSNLDIALRQVNRLLKISEELISFGETGSQSSELYIGEYELHTLLKDIIDIYTPIAETRNIKINLETNFTFLNVWTDKSRLEYILKNLINNAITHALDGAAITIYGINTEEEWSIEIKDDTSVLSAKEHRQFFKMYFNFTTNNQHIGTVFMMKFITSLHGKIAINSTGRKGALIRVNFKHGYRQFKDALIEKRETGETLPMQEPYEENAETFKDPGQLKNILIVEDNEEMARYLRQTIEKDYNVQLTTSAHTAENILTFTPVDLIISEYHLQGMGGNELCKRIKTKTETSHIPVILLTSRITNKELIEGLSTQADTIVQKPFDLNLLKARIGNILANRELLKERYSHSLSSDENYFEKINCSDDKDWQFIAKVKNVIEDRMDDPGFNVDDLCKELGMSRTSFYNKIKALTGYAPADFKRLLKMRGAAALIRERKYSITEVGAMFGYSDAKHFRRSFKAVYGVSPKEYADRYKKQEENNNL